MKCLSVMDFISSAVIHIRIYKIQTKILKKKVKKISSSNNETKKTFPGKIASIRSKTNCVINKFTTASFEAFEYKSGILS